MPRPADGVTLRSLTVYGTQYIVELAKINKGQVSVFLINEASRYVKIAEVTLPKDFSLILKTSKQAPRTYFLRVLRYVDLYLKAQADFRQAEVKIEILDVEGNVIDDSSKPNPCAVSMERADFRTLTAQKALANQQVTEKKKGAKVISKKTAITGKEKLYPETEEDEDEDTGIRWA